MIVRLLALLCFVLAPSAAMAQQMHNLTVTPAVIDETAKARDILNESITIVNTSDHLLQLYPSVNNVDNASGEQGFAPAGTSKDLQASLANWIELSRGVVNIGPGEQRVIPLTITVSSNAQPGTYHAQISFTTGQNRVSAEASAPLGTVTVNLTVKDDIKELMQLQKFSTDNVVFSGDDVVFNYNLQNIGNQDVRPNGQITIYDRRGEEVATIDVNKEGKSVSPAQITQLASTWSATNGFGRYKALLTINYGSQTASVQDTIFFWIIPWQKVLAILTVGFAAIVFFALYFQKWFEERHLHKLASAGLLRQSEGIVPNLPPAMPASMSQQIPPSPTLRAAWSARIAGAFASVRTAASSLREPKNRPLPTLSRHTERQKEIPPPLMPAPTPVLAAAAPVAVEPSAPAYQAPVASAPIPASAPARIEPASGTINLKAMRAQKQPPETGEQHVINLKKMR